MKHKGTVILLIVFIVSGVTGCRLVLRDYLLLICRPELILICIMVAVVLILVRKCSFELLWGSSWVLCVLRFWGQIRWDTVPEKLLLLFTIGGISGLCALAIKKAAEPYCLK